MGVRASRCGLSCLAAVIAASGSAHCAEIAILIHDDPPNIRLEGDHLTGPLGQRVQAIIQSTGAPFSLKSLPYARAEASTKSDPNTCLVPAVKLPDSEAAYVWAGPLGRRELGLFTLESTNIALKSVDDLRGQNLRVGVVQSEYAESALRSAFPFVKRDPVPEGKLNAKKLAMGRIDLWATSTDNAKFIATQEPQLPPIKEVLPVGAYDIGFACNSATDPQLVKSLQEAIAKTKAGS